ncbi:MAG TPA: HEAT repeat domain-containing protein [Vicinamibacterales bacterium]|nr:HEAT repeat domain-containing protein [Vicinamibacterales bacterium]
MTRACRLPLLLLATLVCTATPRAQSGRLPLSSGDVDDIAILLKLEDTRTFDADALTRLAHARHPEVQRRAIMSIGRIVTDGSRALAAQLRAEFAGNSAQATVLAFASGQLKDPAAVPWLAGALKASSMDTQVAAARALGQIRSPEARTALSTYLAAARVDASGQRGVGEALLSLGRFTDKGADLTPIVRFIKSPDPEIRWRVAWALFRPRDPAALPHLQLLIADSSPEVRFWAVRGLSPAVVDQASADRALVSSQIRKLVHDSDRRVQTEALRALLQFDDEGAFAELLAALKSPDPWLSTSAAENFSRFQSAHADALRPALVAASRASQSVWLRQLLLTPLTTLAPDAAIDVAASLARESAGVARTAGVQALGRLGDAGRARYQELTTDAAITTPLPPLPTPRPTPAPGAAATGAAGAAGAAAGAGAGGGAPGGGRRGGGSGATRAPITPRPDAEYRRIVETWIVPDYNGQPKPHAIWEMTRGTIEIELNAGDAPLGMEYLVKAIESGDIVGTEFSRVVPNFVDQQAGIRNAPTLRDEVNLLGLNRGTVAWASSGLDTGRPGYTLGITPQPHNEGDFTAFGRIVAGLDVVDHTEWGDKILSARIIRK